MYCMYVYACMYCMYVYACMYVCMYACLFVCLYVCICLSVCACARACVRVCVCKYVRYVLHIYIYVWACRVTMYVYIKSLTVETLGCLSLKGDSRTELFLLNDF